MLIDKTSFLSLILLFHLDNLCRKSSPLNIRCVMRHSMSWRKNNTLIAFLCPKPETTMGLVISMVISRMKNYVVLLPEVTCVN